MNENERHITRETIRQPLQPNFLDDAACFLPELPRESHEVQAAGYFLQNHHAMELDKPYGTGSDHADNLDQVIEELQRPDFLKQLSEEYAAALRSRRRRWQMSAVGFVAAAAASGAVYINHVDNVQDSVESALNPKVAKIEKDARVASLSYAELENIRLRIHNHVLARTAKVAMKERRLRAVIQNATERAQIDYAAFSLEASKQQKRPYSSEIVNNKVKDVTETLESMPGSHKALQVGQG